MYVLYTVKTATCSLGVCRALCGFLNTGEGGAVYIGVGDNGRVLGLTYTNEQLDHLIQSISHTLSLYSPPVRRELWDVSNYVCSLLPANYIYVFAFDALLFKLLHVLADHILTDEVHPCYWKCISA